MKLLHFFEYHKENALSPWEDRKKNLAQKSKKGLLQLFFTALLFLSFFAEPRVGNKCRAVHKAMLWTAC